MKPIFLGKCESDELLDLTTGASRGIRNVCLTSDDLRTHVLGIGAPGSGKSKMIEWIVRELIDRREGFCLIDPHGTLFASIIEYLAYVRPDVEVVLFNPSFKERVVGFNPFRLEKGDLSAYSDSMVRAILRVWGVQDGKDTPRLKRWLKCVLYAVIEQKLSLDMARYLLSFDERAIRSHLTQRIKAPAIRDEFTHLAGHKRVEDFLVQVESTRNRLFDFYESPSVRRIVSLDHHTLDLREIVEGKKILLCNLHEADSLSTENASLLGTLLINNLWSVAKQRKRKGRRDPHDFFVIMDEFQRFITPDIPDILPQSRKFGLKFFLFQQLLAQLKQKDSYVFDAVMNTCQTKIVFGGLSFPDAQIMVDELFSGDINYQRVKFLNQQVEFWPEVGRAKSYGSSDSTGNTHTFGDSSASNTGSSHGLTFGPEFDNWMMSDVTMNGNSYSDLSTDSTSNIHTDSVSDLPFIYPIKHVVTRPPVTFELNETLRTLAALLKRQHQRHYLIGRLGHPTVAAVAPTVLPYNASDRTIDRYVKKCLRGYLSAEAIDDELIRKHEQLARDADVLEARHFPEDVWEKQEIIHELSS